MTSASPSHVPAPAPLTRGLLLLMAAMCGLLVGSLYFSQPLTLDIARDLGLAPSTAGFIVTLTQLGYCAGLLLLTPLGDKVENKRLVLCTMASSSLALLAAAFAPDGSGFLIVSFVLGLTACAVQMLVPLAVHMAEPERRGRVLGVMTGGLLLGILLSRPVSSALAGWGSWRTVFGSAAVVIAVATVVLAWRLPTYRPVGGHSYASLLASLWTVLRGTPVLQKRAFSHAALFGTFSLFWTSVPWLLTAHGIGQHGIALFALAGAGGALIAPMAGRWADHGHTRRVTIVAMLITSAAFAATCAGGPMWLLVFAGIALDAGVQANHVVGQREVLTASNEARSRLNSVYMCVFFIGAAITSSMAGGLYQIGWQAVAAVGAALPLVALAIYLAFGARQVR
ncbi:MFS transporter [Burkholderiaceae bacterium UC74_6]